MTFFVFACLGFVAPFESVALCFLSVFKFSDNFLLKSYLCYIISLLSFQDSNYTKFTLGSIYIVGSCLYFINFLSCN